MDVCRVYLAVQPWNISNYVVQDDVRFWEWWREEYYGAGRCSSFLRLTHGPGPHYLLGALGRWVWIWRSAWAGLWTQKGEACSLRQPEGIRSLRAQTPRRQD